MTSNEEIEKVSQAIDARHKFLGDMEHLIKHGAVNIQHRIKMVEEFEKDSSQTALQVADKLGVHNANHAPLDMAIRFNQHLVKNKLFELRCFLKGIDGFKNQLMMEGMKLFGGRCPPQLLNDHLDHLFGENNLGLNDIHHPADDLLMSLGIPVNLITEVKEHCLKNDAAHQIDHVFGVVALAETIIRKHPDLLAPWRKSILLASLLHDVAHHLGRAEHHDNGALIASELVYRHMPDDLSGVELRYMMDAIRQHRSSFKGERTHVVSEVVAAADLGVPNYERYAKRAMVYALDHFLNGQSCLDNDDACGEIPLETAKIIMKTAVDHVYEKYGREGYAWKSMSRFVMLTWPNQVDTTRMHCTDTTLVTAYMMRKGWAHAVKKTLGYQPKPFLEFR